MRMGWWGVFGMSILIPHRESTATSREPPEAARAVKWPPVGIGALLRSPRAWLALRKELRCPVDHRGARLRFADGTEEYVFRETVVAGAKPVEPCVLIVGFRLRLLRRGAVAHALFRRLSIVNTPLFAGFPGFATKLWLADATTGEYRGVYDWNNAEAARYYAESLCALLRIGSVRGSVRYHVEPGITRDTYLRGPSPGESVTGWWRLREPLLGAPGRSLAGPSPSRAMTETADDRD